MARIDDSKLDALLAHIAELKTDLNALRTDFLTHEHGTTYNAATLRMNGGGVTPSGGLGTAVASSLPTDLYDSAN